MAHIKRSALYLIVSLLTLVSCDLFVDKIKKVHGLLQWYNKYKKEGKKAEMRKTRRDLSKYLAEQPLRYYHQKECREFDYKNRRTKVGEDCDVEVIVIDTSMLIDNDGRRTTNSRFNFVEWIEREYNKVTELRSGDIALLTGSTLAGAAAVGGIALAIGSSFVAIPALVGGAIIGGITSAFTGNSVSNKKSQYVDPASNSDSTKSQGQEDATASNSKRKPSWFCWSDC